MPRDNSFIALGVRSTTPRILLITLATPRHPGGSKQDHIPHGSTHTPQRQMRPLTALAEMKPTLSRNGPHPAGMSHASNNPAAQRKWNRTTPTPAPTETEPQQRKYNRTSCDGAAPPTEMCLCYRRPGEDPWALSRS